MRSTMIVQCSDGTTRRRGITLVTVIVAAMVFSIAAYAVLFMSMSMSNRQSFNEKDVRSRYAAEAGIVWAMQKLWADPLECFGGPNDLPLDDDGDPVTPDVMVDITAKTDLGVCPAPSGQRLKLEAKVTF